jgi:hypothetical protein
MQEARANPAANSVLRNGIGDEFPGERERRDRIKERSRKASTGNSL